MPRRASMWPPTITDCQCEQPGWCPRHNCLKNIWEHRLCRRQPEVFASFERGEGPCLPTESVGEINGDATTLEAVEAVAPGLLRRSLNFATAVAKHAADGLRRVSEETLEQRLTVCRTCPACDTERLICRRPECGCLLEIKAAWHSETCPLGQWPILTDSESD